MLCAAGLLDLIAPSRMTNASLTSAALRLMQKVSADDTFPGRHKRCIGVLARRTPVMDCLIRESAGRPLAGSCQHAAPRIVAAVKGSTDWSKVG